MMLAAELLESLMLVCFSTSWFWMIRKVWREHDSRDMSRAFPVLVAVGCLFGLASKVALYLATGIVSFLVLIYAWNVIVALAQLYLIVKMSYDIDRRRIVGAGEGSPEAAAG
jgi:hypothetical protein